MLEIGFGLKEEAKTVVAAVDKVLKEGFRTNDIADGTTNPYKVLGTKEMGKLVLKYITQKTYTN
jgi:3-isopropylmalate dehydrogenase